LETDQKNNLFFSKQNVFKFEHHQQIFQFNFKKSINQLKKAKAAINQAGRMTFGQKLFSRTTFGQQAFLNRHFGSLTNG
jgi:hypothetical protein